MAKYECTVPGRLEDLRVRIEHGIVNGSISASIEDGTDYRCGDTRVSVRVFERYSYLGKNRVSLTVTLIQHGNDPVYVCGITSGGSQGMFLKINTFGEEAFLEKLRGLL